MLRKEQGWGALICQTSGRIYVISKLALVHFTLSGCKLDASHDDKNPALFVYFGIALSHSVCFDLQAFSVDVSMFLCKISHYCSTVSKEGFAYIILPVSINLFSFDTCEHRFLELFASWYLCLIHLSLHLFWLLRFFSCFMYPSAGPEEC